MTNDEAKAIFSEIFTAFPGFREWLAKVQEPADTYAVWCRMLGSVRYEIGKRVVEMLIDGTRKMPKAYERDQLPILIKSYAARIEQDERAKRVEEDKRRETEEARLTRQRSRDQYKLPLTKGFAMMRQIGHDLREGKITREEHDAEYERIRLMTMELTNQEYVT